VSALAVALGGAIGALLRYGVGLWLNRGDLPWGTFAVNLLGSFLIGCIVFWSARQNWPQNAVLFAVTGVLGGFTTFSAFSLENLQLVQSGRPGLALLYGLASPALGLVMAYLGSIVVSSST
jgi:CrcB protein